MIRPDLSDLTAAQIAPLERAITPFPDTWRDLARSHYCTLLGRCGDAEDLGADRLAELAELAADLARGIGQDLGGTQPYIPVGAANIASEKALQVMQAWRAGRPVEAIARDAGVSERHVRRIISELQHAAFARAQQALPI